MINPQQYALREFCRAMIDTGTSTFSMPKVIYNKIKKDIEINDNCTGYEKAPTLSFEIHGQKYILKKEEYIRKYKNKTTGKVECEMLIEELDLDANDDVWLVGEMFINKYFTVFDRDTDSIHFALRR